MIRDKLRSSMRGPLAKYFLSRSFGGGADVMDFGAQARLQPIRPTQAESQPPDSPPAKSGRGSTPIVDVVNVYRAANRTVFARVNKTDYFSELMARDDKFTDLHT